MTLWDATNDDGPLGGDINEEARLMYEEQFKLADDLGVTPLGSGSDYTVFLQHIGVSPLTHISRRCVLTNMMM